jgi:hypothetical protein
MAKKKPSNTGWKLGKHTPSEASKATQFKKGYDPRRNLNGRPKAFDDFRKLAQDIGEQIATTKDGTSLKWNGQEVTWAEFILLSWLTDKKYMEKFSDIAYGKVPQPITGKNEEPLLPPLPDEERLERIRQLAPAITAILTDGLKKDA